jgi:hypothetical protein
LYLKHFKNPSLKEKEDGGRKIRVGRADKVEKIKIYSQ